MTAKRELADVHASNGDGLRVVIDSRGRRPRASNFVEVFCAGCDRPLAVGFLRNLDAVKLVARRKRLVDRCCTMSDV